MLTIPQNDPKAGYLAQQAEIDAAIAAVLHGGYYILGKETVAFEEAFAAFIGCRYALGVGSGTDAIVLALRALGIGPGKSVATVSHTAVATVAAIEMAGAIPALIDIEPERFTMDPAALEAALAEGSIDAIIVVHLYGQAADLDAILSLAQRYDIPLIEDCAQAHGAAYHGQPVGGFGRISCFSFYPTKNLGALGDGGAVATNDADLAAELRAIREYGWRERRYVSERDGINSRLDELQAAILSVKLRQLPNDNARRRDIAAAYTEALRGSSIIPPVCAADTTHVFHQYVVRAPGRRDALRQSLKLAGIGTNIHYPVPIHRQPAYEGRTRIGPADLAMTERAAAEILSLPIYPQLTDAAVDQTVEALREVA